MIIAFYLEDMSSKLLGEFFENMHDFALSKFDIKISDKGIITIDGVKNTISYNLDSYTKEEAIDGYIGSIQFKLFVKSRFWALYKAEKIV